MPVATNVDLLFNQSVGAGTAGNVRLFSAQRGGQLVRTGRANPPPRADLRVVNSLNPPDTIVAPATAAGAAGLHVIRLSGPQAIPLADALFQGKKPLMEVRPRTLHYGPLTDGAGRVLDDVVVALFRAPHSYTREDVVEISTHGSDYIVGEVLAALVAHGARLAGPGEFTQRAFLNGALDLAQAEAVADLIAADSALAHRVAVQQLRGGVSNQLRELRQELIDFAALLELELDFAEEDVEFAHRPALTALLGRVLETVDELRATFGLGNAIKNGVVTVIAGRPNAGKSTLLNALVGEERAIVSSIAGTTRDLIEDEVMLGGLRFRFVDTAGLRETTDEIEAMGVARTRARTGQAALLVYVYDLTTATAAEARADVAALLAGRAIPVLLVGNKADRGTPGSSPAPRAAAGLEPGVLGGLQTGQFTAVRISAHHPADIQRLKTALVETARAAGLDANATATIITNARHHAALSRAADALRAVLTGLTTGLGTELLAYDLRAALAALGEITGDVTPDDLLGSIFGRFCIGK